MRQRFLSPLPKYDFREPLKRCLHVKLGTIRDINGWIKGQDEAADGCCRIALRMALDVYLRTCFAKGTDDHSIDDAVKALTEIGFTEEEIREEAQGGHFSLFFFK